ncbi:hypothetical protein Bca52824_045815 [Brassica carinata]|uniref:Uncharacterized protein n=1 Tax=Brassica carinata TaxID=52824 RepID=A0A8X7RD47_BRACI|nr:hypothetical protein Bca52824_045815 [Brassica carinata]
MNVAGVVKDWLLIAFSWSVIKDTVTPLNLLGTDLRFGCWVLQSLQVEGVESQRCLGDFHANEEVGELARKVAAESITAIGHRSLDIYH